MATDTSLIIASIGILVDTPELPCFVPEAKAAIMLVRCPTMTSQDRASFDEVAVVSRTPRPFFVLLDAETFLFLYPWPFSWPFVCCRGVAVDRISDHLVATPTELP